MTSIRRVPWTRQPQYAARLKERAWVFNGPTLANHNGGIWTNTNGPTLTPNQYGLARSFVAASSQALTTGYDGPNTGLTSFAVLRLTVTGTNRSVVGIGASGSSRTLLYYTSAERLAFYVGDGVTFGQAVETGTFSDTTTYHVVAGRSITSASRDIWRNGAQLATDTATCAQSGLNTVAIGANYHTGALQAGIYGSEDILIAGVIPRVLSDTEVAFLTRRPENAFAFLFQPRRSIFPVSAGAASGTGSITQADGVATTSTLTGSSVAATTPTQADGVATAATLTGSSIAAAAFTQADGVATTSTLVGSDAGTSSSAITAAAGSATASTLAGSSIAAADFVAAAGVATTATMAAPNDVTGRRVRRSRTKFLPPAVEQQTTEQPPAAPQRPKTGLVTGDAMTLLVETVTAEGVKESKRKARVAVEKRRLEIQAHNVKALDSALLAWF